MKNLNTLRANTLSDGTDALSEGTLATPVSAAYVTAFAVAQPQSLLNAPAKPYLPLPISPSVTLTDGDYRESVLGASDDESYGGTYNWLSSDYSKDSGNGKGGDGGNGTADESSEDGSGCGWFVERLSAFQDGELDSDETVAVADHIDMCDRCSHIYAALEATDNLLEREWSMSAPLPSSLKFEHAIDAIMTAIPTDQPEAPSFPTRRVHARSRWMRFATAIASAVVILACLWASYHLGYVQGRQSVLSTPTHEILTNSIATP